MILAMPLVAHVAMSLLMLALPHITRREILFGVVLPADFRSSPEGRKAVREFRFAVMIPAVAGAVAIVLLGSRFVPVFLLAPVTMMLAAFMTFVSQNRKLKAFAVQPQPVRVVELSGEPERLPWFTWLGLVPLLLLLAAAWYLYANWDSIPARYPVHFDIDGNPNRWGDRSFRGVYAPLVFGAEMVIWFFGFALAIWYGSRQSEPLRRPTMGFLIAVEWIFGLMMASVALGPVVHLPVGMVAVGGMPIILLSVIYLIKKSRDPRAPVDPTPNECWKGGMFYYNPHDATLFVGRRDGVGFTSNMGNPWSWVMLGSLPVLIAIGFLALR
jgi:uncharacterized membrane protein